MKYFLIALFFLLTLNYAGITDFETETRQATNHTPLIGLILVLGIIIALWDGPNDNNNNKNLTT